MSENIFTSVFKIPGHLFWWLSIPFSWILRVKLLPDIAIEKVTKPSRGQPLIYAMPHRSLSDLLVLYLSCKRLGLPLPIHPLKLLTSSGQAGYLYLNKLGFFQPKRTGEPPSLLQKLCQRLEQESSINVMLVPVAIYWGRNPGKEERSLFKLLFPDEEHAGILQKLFIILAQSRNVFIHFGAPISMREQIASGPNVDQIARKIRRVLRVHFRTQRSLTIGPKIYDRSQVLRFLFNSNLVQKAIDAESHKQNEPRARVEERAKKYLDEIASSQAFSMLLFFDVFLRWVFTKIYEGIVVKNLDIIRKNIVDHEIVYVSSHRSHLDYLVVPYELFYNGLATPHIAAGANLNFWPAGPILRRGGAFFLRRSIRGNRLYAVCFTEYLNYLLIKGHPVGFFPEGGRSRTGRLLAPKTGMLSMIVQSFMRDPAKPVVLVPVYIGYDKVAEVKTYAKELRGASKKKEGVREFLGIWRILRSKHGKAYVGFGDPISLDQYLDHVNPSWRHEKEDMFDSKPSWLVPAVQNLATKIMRGINEVILISPVSLVSFILIAAPQKALAEEDLIFAINKIRELLNARKLEFAPAYVPSMLAKDLIHYVERIAPIFRFDYPDGGQVIYLNEIESSFVTYYRNNILSLFALPALACAHLQHGNSISRSELIESCMRFYPLLADEFFLKWPPEEAPSVISQTIDELLEVKILSASKTAIAGESIERPLLTTSEFGVFRILSRSLGSILERYSIAFLTIIENQRQLTSIEIIETHFQKTLQAFNALAGSFDSQLLDKDFFQGIHEHFTHSLTSIKSDMNTVLSDYEASCRKILGDVHYEGVLRSLKGDRN